MTGNAQKRPNKAKRDQKGSKGPKSIYHVPYVVETC